MKHTVRLFFLSLVVATSLTNCKPKQQDPKPELTASENQLCEQQNFDKTIALKIRSYTDSSLLAFPYIHVMQDSGKDNAILMDLPGISFHETPAVADRMMEELWDTLFLAGYTLFRSEHNFGIMNSPDELCVLKTTDKFRVLKLCLTDGINYGMDNDSVITVLKTFDAKYGLKITGAGMDWCSFTITRPPGDWMTLANEVYTICPDVVDQGADTKEALAAEMERTRVLYLWWD